MKSRIGWLASSISVPASSSSSLNPKESEKSEIPQSAQFRAVDVRYVNGEVEGFTERADGSDKGKGGGGRKGKGKGGK